MRERKNSILESRKRILTTRIISKGKHEARANSWWRLVVPTGDRESLISTMTFPRRGIERVTSLNCPLETFEWVPRLNAAVARVYLSGKVRPPVKNKGGEEKGFALPFGAIIYR